MNLNNKIPSILLAQFYSLIILITLIKNYKQQNCKKVPSTYEGFFIQSALYMSTKAGAMILVSVLFEIV